MTGPNVRGVSFSLHAGEVLGIGGLAGHGHRELFRMLFGDAHCHRRPAYRPWQARRFRSPRAAIAAGIALVPEDRKTEGLLLRMSVRDNATLAILKRLTRFGVLRPADGAAGGAERRRQPACAHGGHRPSRSARSAAAISRRSCSAAGCSPSAISCCSMTSPAASMSRPNMKSTSWCSKLATEGHAIVFYSSDAEELAHLCHRVLVMREGVVAAELHAPGITAEDIVSAAVRDHLAA